MIVKKCAVLVTLPTWYRRTDNYQMKFRRAYVVKTDDVLNQPTIDIEDLPKNEVVKLIKTTGSCVVPESKYLKSVKSGGEIAVLDKDWKSKAEMLFLLPTAVFKAFANKYSSGIESHHSNCKVEWLIDFDEYDSIAITNTQFYYLSQYNSTVLIENNIYMDKYCVFTNDVSHCSQFINESELAKYSNAERPEFKLDMMKSIIDMFKSCDDSNRKVAMGILLNSDWENDYPYLYFAWCQTYAASIITNTEYYRSNRFKQLDARFNLSSSYGILAFFNGIDDVDIDIPGDLFPVALAAMKEHVLEILSRNNFLSSYTSKAIIMNYIIQQ